MKQYKEDKKLIATSFGPEETPEETMLVQMKKKDQQEHIKKMLNEQMTHKQMLERDMRQQTLDNANRDHEEGKNILLSLRKINNVNKDSANDMFLT